MPRPAVPQEAAQLGAEGRCWGLLRAAGNWLEDPPAEGRSPPEGRPGTRTACLEAGLRAAGPLVSLALGKLGAPAVEREH